jgi:glycosyltransferase involved in cell wall biosynthesis
MVSESRTRLTAILIVYNEAHCIERCLRSLTSIADEIVVLDSGSTDDTVAIARSYGASVAVTDWPGFGPQKNRALERARGEWVLSIDADERVTPELATSIRSVILAQSVDVNGWYIPFLATWGGEPVRFGDWANKQHLRLFRRTAAHFSNDHIHERVVCQPPFGTLNGRIIHDTVVSEADAAEKRVQYANLSAQRICASGRGGLVSAITHSFWTLIRGFILKGGFLDGVIGWKVTCATTRGTWLRYRLAGQLRRKTLNEIN